jgi:hypothetical protein
MTKFEALKNYIARKGEFGWSDLSKHFGYRPNQLNSYTTYLNSLRRAGFVEHTGRGRYKVLDAKELRNTSGSTVMSIIRNQQLTARCVRAETELRTTERESIKLMRHNLGLEQTVSEQKRYLVDAHVEALRINALLERYQDMCNDREAIVKAYRAHWVFRIYRFFGGKV